MVAQRLQPSKSAVSKQRSACQICGVSDENYESTVTTLTTANSINFAWNDGKIEFGTMQVINAPVPQSENGDTVSGKCFHKSAIEILTNRKKKEV